MCSTDTTPWLTWLATGRSPARRVGRHVGARVAETEEMVRPALKGKGETGIASTLAFTSLQGQYLAFIQAYTVLHGVPPAEADMQRFFRVTAPSIHQMVLTLERRGLLERVPRRARSLRLLVSPDVLPPLQEPSRRRQS